MEKISIKTGRVNIFKPVQQNNEQKHTNPFGLSFKGNVLQADVLQRQNQLKEQASENKLHRKAEQ